ncbi:unnamed protein product [Brassica oleracea]
MEGNQLLMKLKTISMQGIYLLANRHGGFYNSQRNTVLHLWRSLCFILRESNQ